MPEEVDLFVIGAGSGGVRAARISSGYGARVMIAEEYRVGGTCVIRGCVPKKLLVYASRFADEFEDAAGFGWTVPEPKFDWATLIANKDKEIDRLERAYTANLDRAKVKIVKSRAVLLDPHTVKLSATGETVRAKHILIATGGAPSMGKDIEGLEHVISSNEAFHLKELPKRILIQGGGYIAVEFAGIFNGLGSEVTLVYRGDNILRGFDDEVRAHLRTELEKRGIRIVTKAIVEGIEKVNGGLDVELSDHRGGRGRQGDVRHRPPAQCQGPRPRSRGRQARRRPARSRSNEYSQTNVPHIYAVGDVTDRVALTPVAIREGHAFADTVFGKKPTPVDHTNVPTAVFSEPEVGVVGLTEAEACQQLAKVDIYKATFRPMKATLSGRDTRTFMKLVVDGITDRLVGCHIVGPDAGEMIQLIGIAVKMRATKADFDATMAVHPTAAEELVTMREKTATHVRQAAE